jgi:beta-galactosidase
MVHVFPYWDFNDGQIIDIRVCSNAPRIELQLSGVTIGTHDIDHKHGTQLVGWWRVPYAEGEIKAIAYDETGNVIATDVRRSYGDAKKIRLGADSEVLTANGTDLIFLEIGMEDGDGHAVENANNRVRVEVTGEGRLLGLDNGDSTDFDPYKGVSRRLFSGKFMAIIGATLQPGKITVEVSSEGMRTEVAEFESHAAEGGVPEGISANARNQELPCMTGRSEEIPLRKIEIVSDAGQCFDESVKEIVVRAKLYPENTTYRDVEWRAVTDEGIDSNIAKVEAAGLEAKITAIGDGAFRLRCTSKNGTAKTKLISQLEFKATGLGTAYKDPYDSSRRDFTITVKARSGTATKEA